MEPAERYVTIREAADLTGRTLPAIQRRVDRGTLPSTKRGNRRLIPIAALYESGLLGLPPAATVDAMLDRIETLARRVGELEQENRQLKESR